MTSALLTKLNANFPKVKVTSERLHVLEKLLEPQESRRLRSQIGRRIVQLLHVEYLVPEIYKQWRPLVTDAMFFLTSRLSAARLAPKLIEQIGLPANTKPEMRLLRLIAKVPGLQKLGQVLARNRHLRPSLRRMLTKLENGICDVNAGEIREIVRAQLRPKLKIYSVEIERTILFEASVSALVRFTWQDPSTRRRERGVFKVMKPYVPPCFAEDMRLLGRLARYLGSRQQRYEIASRGIPDTFEEARQLLRHEVQFLREQRTLRNAQRLYNKIPGIRVPQVIQPLCTSKIIAMTEERGEKVTDAVRSMPARARSRVCEELIEALIATPMFAPGDHVMFHADPHAGNLLYDKRTGELALVDWALTEELSAEQRRHLAVLFLMIALRDPTGICSEIQALSADRTQSQYSYELIRDCVGRFLNHLSPTSMPGAAEAMHLVERVAYEGIRFPAPLIMLRKVLFTLDGILHDIAGSEVALEAVLARHALRNWLRNFTSFGSPLYLPDWARVQFSFLLYASRMWMQSAQAALRGV